MPKIKSNRTASKRFKATGTGKAKRAQANKSHNTAKRSPKRIRQLRPMTVVDKTNMGNVKGMLPYLIK